jgi:restriction system protein
MARRQRTSLGEDFMLILSRLPWWACLVVAVAAFLILHSIASQPYATAVKPSEMVAAMYGSVFRGAAMVGQYVIPLLAGAAAVISYAGGRRRRELLLHATEGGDTAAAIDAMSWQEFELLIAEAFRLQGFAVVEKGGSGADDGVDLEMTKDGERWLVQAKHWRSRRVPVEVVRELAGVMPFRRAVGGYVVTSGRFTRPAEDFARGRDIKLVNGSRLAGMLNQARASLDATARGPSGKQQVSPPQSEAPCPDCAAPMVRRLAGRGPNAGREFWGCSRFPKCKGTRPV